MTLTFKEPFHTEHTSKNLNICALGKKINEMMIIKSLLKSILLVISSHDLIGEFQTNLRELLDKPSGPFGKQFGVSMT
jgi:hypothetical protein